MMQRRIIWFVVLALLLSACTNSTLVLETTPSPEAAAPTQAANAPTIVPTPASTSGLTPATITADEGGPVTIEGAMSYTNAQIADFYTLPVPLLFNISRELVNDFGKGIDNSGQVLGVMTSPIAPSPASYRVSLPIAPAGPTVDLDNNGRDDGGVQVYSMLVSIVLVGDSYVSAYERGGYESLVTDPLTQAAREGTLLVYAPDADQGFPAGSGPDAVYFTADDPTVGLPAGYTLATLGSDGTVSFARPRLGRIDVRESAANELVSFADQGLAEGFNSLIDHLSIHYAYTELRALDWEEIRQRYLPRIEAADAANDVGDYLLALNALAFELRDFHVGVTGMGISPEIAAAANQKNSLAFNTNAGVGVKTLSDGRVIVYYVDPAGPAAAAGWVFGTEIISVQGQPINDWIDGLTLRETAATPQKIRSSKEFYTFLGPSDTIFSVEYRQPGEAETRSVSLTTGAYVPGTVLHTYPTESISSDLVGDRYGYIQWRHFDNLRYTIAFWENFLAQIKSLPGIIIDMRGNGGGSVSLASTMSSYLYAPDAPARLSWYDTYIYDEQQGLFVLRADPDYPSSSLRPDLTYTGKVVVLIDDRTGSSGEYFSQDLQFHERALIVGATPSAGGGGNPETIPMPGGLGFAYTKQRTTWPDSQEPNIEGRGVQPDLLVPITEQFLAAQLAGGDPLLDAAIELLNQETQ
ncbi:S41 family peptidase [Candidatus Chloroploca sp. Khr17]|uniref:S41 family peptidase n=1 Tax=Candidatus Chloroploca sp. Khr17 TaxID=2496869 RepID=UPI0013EDADE0|nr:S41 family peptidase [Candidatus Chloroploca sp. Khr17]